MQKVPGRQPNLCSPVAGQTGRAAIFPITSQRIVKLIWKLSFQGRKTTQCCFNSQLKDATFSEKKNYVYSVNTSKHVCFGFFFSSCTFSLLPSQVLQDCMRHHSSIVEIGKLWVSLSITVVIIYLFSYVCPIRTEEASSFNCALLSRSGPPP